MLNECWSESGTQSWWVGLASLGCYSVYQLSWLIWVKLFVHKMFSIGKTGSRIIFHISLQRLKIFLEGLLCNASRNFTKASEYAQNLLGSSFVRIPATLLKRDCDLGGFLLLLWKFWGFYRNNWGKVSR